MAVMSWLQTREGSTLAVATFLASTSLLLLTVEPTNSFLKVSADGSIDEQTSKWNIALLGLAFGAAGFSYRQVTSWTIDRIQHNRNIDLARLYIAQLDDVVRTTVRHLIEDRDVTKICQEQYGNYIQAVKCYPELANIVETLQARHQRRIYYYQALIREYLIVVFLFMPIALWQPIAFPLHNFCWHTSAAVCTILFSLIVAGFVLGVEFGLRFKDKKKHFVY